MTFSHFALFTYEYFGVRSIKKLWGVSTKAYFKYLLLVPNSTYGLTRYISMHHKQPSPQKWLFCWLYLVTIATITMHQTTFYFFLTDVGKCFLTVSICVNKRINIAQHISIISLLMNTMKPRQNGRHFVDDVRFQVSNSLFGMEIWYENDWCPRFQLTLFQHWYW